MSYAKFDPEKSEMLAVAIKHNGNVQAIARHFNIGNDTIYQYFKRDPEGKKIIDDVRGLNTETDLDLAEHIFRYNMSNFKNNPGLAQRAAEKVIDGKGHLRNWNEQILDKQPPNQSNLDMTMINARQQNRISKLEKELKIDE